MRSGVGHPTELPGAEACAPPTVLPEGLDVTPRPDALRGDSCVEHLTGIVQIGRHIDAAAELRSFHEYLEVCHPPVLVLVCIQYTTVY